MKVINYAAVTNATNNTPRGINSITANERIKQDAEGLQSLEVKSNDGWSDRSVVEKVTRMEQQGLMLVATDDATYLMTVRGFDTPIE